MFLSQFNAVYERVLGNNNFLADYHKREVEYPDHDNSRQDQRPEDIIIYFNEYLKIITVGLKHLDTGVKAIAKNMRLEFEELPKGTEKIILTTRRDPEQGRTWLLKC